MENGKEKENGKENGKWKMGDQRSQEEEISRNKFLKIFVCESLGDLRPMPSTEKVPKQFKQFNIQSSL